MKHWNLLGSLDGLAYEIIDEQSNWIWPLGKFGFPEKTFEIDNVNECYQYFKIQITGKNGGHIDFDCDWLIWFNGLELYGFVQGNK